MLRGQEKGDGVCRDPEEGDALHHDKAVMHVPVDVEEDLSKLWHADYRNQRTLIAFNVCIGYFVKSHHQGGKENIQNQTDAEGGKDF